MDGVKRQLARKIRAAVFRITAGRIDRNNDLAEEIIIERIPPVHGSLCTHGKGYDIGGVIMREIIPVELPDFSIIDEADMNSCLLYTSDAADE